MVADSFCLFPFVQKSQSLRLFPHVAHFRCRLIENLCTGHYSGYPFFYHVINNPQSALKLFHFIPPPLCSAATMHSGYSVHNLSSSSLCLSNSGTLVSPASTKGSLNIPRAWPLFVPNQRAHLYPSTAARSCWISIDFHRLSEQHILI